MPRDSSSNLSVLFISLVLVVMALPTACGPQLPAGAPQTAREHPEQIRVMNPPVVLQDFTMVASTGGDLSLSELRGQWLVLFFGYTRCPDFCPLTLSDYQRIKRDLGEQADRVTFLYISVDPYRDTPEIMQAHLNLFDPDFLGLTGTDATLTRIQPDYDFYFRRQVLDGDPPTYVVDHSTRTYVINAQSELVASVAYQTPTDITVALLREYLAADDAAN